MPPVRRANIAGVTALDRQARDRRLHGNQLDPHGVGGARNGVCYPPRAIDLFGREGRRLPESANLRVQVLVELGENDVVERLRRGVALLRVETRERVRAVGRVVEHLRASQRAAERRVGLWGACARARETKTEKSILARHA